jgi:hypothetical protein
MRGAETKHKAKSRPTVCTMPSETIFRCTESFDNMESRANLCKIPSETLGRCIKTFYNREQTAGVHHAQGNYFTDCKAR